MHVADVVCRCASSWMRKQTICSLINVLFCWSHWVWLFCFFLCFFFLHTAAPIHTSYIPAVSTRLWSWTTWSVLGQLNVSPDVVFNEYVIYRLPYADGSRLGIIAHRCASEGKVRTLLEREIQHIVRKCSVKWECWLEYQVFKWILQ